MPPRTAKKNTVTSAVKKAPAKSPVKSKPPPKPEVIESIDAEKPAVTVEGDPVQDDAKNQAGAVEAAGSVQANESNGTDAGKGDEDNKDERLELGDDEPEPDYEEDADEPLKDEAETADAKENGLGEDVEGEEEEEDVDEDKENGGEEEGDVQEGEDEGHEDEDVEGEGEEIEGEGDEEEDGGAEGEGDEDDNHIIDMPAPLKERQRQREFEVFVGGLDKEATEEDLKKVFSEVGEVKEVRMTKNPATQKNRGFAFVQFATIEQAKRALTELKNPQVREKRCGVSPSQDNDTLYVGNICKTWTKDAVMDKLKSYGIENIEQLALADDPKNEGSNRGFAFLEFTTHLDAMNAYKRLQKKDAIFGCDRTAKVAFAESSIQPDEEVMAQVKTVFVDGLPSSWDEERVKEEFGKYGEIEKVQLARNMSSAKRKDYGFVIFSSRDSALTCVEGINNSELGEGDNKIKANLAKPQHKGRLVKQGVRGGYRIGAGAGKGGKAARARKPGRSKSKGPGGRDGKGVAGRGGRNRGRKLNRQASGRTVPDKVRDRPITSLNKAHDRQRPALSRIRSRRDYGRQGDLYYGSEVQSLSRSALDLATSVAASRRSSYRVRGASRSAMRRLPYPEDGYSRHLERALSYADLPGHPYDAVSGTKRSYAAVDDAPRYADPALRHTRARLDYDVAAGAPLYRESSYGQSARLPRGRNSAIGQQSYGVYDTHQSAAAYGGSSLGGPRVGGVYPSGYDRAVIGGSPYSSIYSSRNSSGGYLPGRNSGTYY